MCTGCLCWTAEAIAAAAAALRHPRHRLHGEETTGLQRAQPLLPEFHRSCKSAACRDVSAVTLRMYVQMIYVQIEYLNMDKLKINCEL